MLQQSLSRKGWLDDVGDESDRRGISSISAGRARTSKQRHLPAARSGANRTAQSWPLRRHPHGAPFAAASEPGHDLLIGAAEHRRPPHHHV
jgi:hypothetical protein